MTTFYRHREHRSGSKPFSSSLASRSTSSKAEGVIPSYSADSIVPNTGSATVSKISVTSNQDKLMPSTNSETNAKADNKSNTLQVDKVCKELVMTIISVKWITYRRLCVKTTLQVHFLKCSRDNTLIEIPSYFNVYDVDRLHFCQTSDALICMRF